MFYIYTYILHAGRDYDTLSSRHQRERKQQIKENTKKYLEQLTGQIGLKPVSVGLETSKGELIHLNLSPTPNTSSSTPKRSVPPSNSQVVSNNLLYLLLKYGMSQKCYHELTQEFDCLPRSYKVRLLSSYTKCS